MIYFDYAANTPTDERVLEVFCRTARDFCGNPNSRHAAGRAAKERVDAAVSGILDCVHAEEAVLTSGASESNNLAIKGVAEAYRENGRHIISTCLEHSSVSGALTYLQTQGYEIDLVDINQNGQVDLEHLRGLMRRDTVLVSICAVDSELGIVQPIEQIAQIIGKYPDCFFHTDATQAIGKHRMDFSGADLVTFTPHKFYGLNGSGVLLKKKDVVLKPLISGGLSTTIYRSGTPVTAQAAAAEAALRLAVGELDERNRHIAALNAYLLNGLRRYPEVILNIREKTLPHFINLSVKRIKAARMQEELDKRGICISTKSACSVPNTPSRAVYALTRDRKTALSSWRISLSHLTSFEELDKFLGIFGEVLSGKI